MPNQNGCNHEVGMEAESECKCGCLIAIHAFSYNVVWLHSDPKIIRHASRDTGYRVFNYCPKCGAKIDWDKIKEEVDVENNR